MWPRWIPRLPLQLWLLLSHGGAVLVPVAVLLGSGAVAQDLRNQTQEDLDHQGAILALMLRDQVRAERQAVPGAALADLGPRLSPLLRETKQATLAGIRVTGPDGVVVATSGDLLGEDLRGDAEVVAALSGRVGHAVRPRPAPTVPQPISSESRRAGVRNFVAVPVVAGDEVLGVVVLSRTPREELQALYHMAPGVVSAGVAAVIGTLVLSGVAGFVATRSLRLLDRGAMRIADGDFRGLEDLERPRRSHLREVAHTADAMATMAERLRDRLAYIAEFASNVSHEFKTPIATLRGTVELLTDDEAMEPAQRARFLANASRELDRLDRLVAGLLSLARADEPASRGPVDLHGVLAEVAAARGIALVGTAGRVQGDRAQLEAVATNLVENAFRHAGSGATVSIEASGSTFSVVDDGVGISPANLPRVFDRFFTTDRAGGGTGLGLALVRTVVVRHGGEVTVESRPGRTAFTVRLPNG